MDFELDRRPARAATRRPRRGRARVPADAGAGRASPATTTRRAFWKTLVELDWPGLTVPEDDGGSGATAVELVIALEELGRVADPTPFLATTSQYVPLVREACPAGDARRDAARRRLRRRHGRGGLRGRHRAAPAPTATAGCSTAPPASCSTATGPTRWPWSARRPTTGAACFVVPPAADVTADADARVRRHPPRRRRRASTACGWRAERAATGPTWPRRRPGTRGGRRRAGRRPSSAPASGCSTWCSTTSRTATSSACPIGSFQAVKHMAVDVYVAIAAGPGAVPLRGPDHRRGRRPPHRGRVDGQGRRRRLPAHRRPHGIQLFGGLGLHLGERPAALRAPGQGRRAAARVERRAPGAPSPAGRSPAARRHRPAEATA